MRASILSVLFTLPLVSHAQPPEPTLLWRVRSAPQAAPSYLYGTVHSKDDRAFQFGDSVLPALDRCAVVAGELDLDKSKQGGTLMFGAMRLPGDQRLQDLYKKKEWKRVHTVITDRMGFMAPMASKLKPFFVMMLLMENAVDGDRPQVLDEYLQQRGAQNGQRVIGIETMAEQLAALDAMSLKEQAAMLLDHVDHDGYKKETEAMLDIYARQDLHGLFEAANDAGGMPEAMEKALLTDRNTRMVHRMDSIMGTGETVFFLIGAAHLPKAEGLIQGLRNKGYSVEAVMSVERKPEPMEMER